MNPEHFSSLSAFLEYYTALQRASSISDGERAVLDASEAVFSILTPDERASLDDPAAGGAAARRRERARRKLARELAGRGMLES